MKHLEAIIYVSPTPKGRPRVTVIGGHAYAYSPRRTATAQADIKAAIRREVMAQGCFEDSTTPLVVLVTFYRARPEHLPKKVLYPVTKPDGNNYESLLFDALNGFVWPDDKQVVDCHWRKRFGSPPRIELLIREGIE